VFCVHADVESEFDVIPDTNDIADSFGYGGSGQIKSNDMYASSYDENWKSGPAPVAWEGESVGLPHQIPAPAPPPQVGADVWGHVESSPCNGLSGVDNGAQISVDMQSSAWEQGHVAEVGDIAGFEDLRLKETMLPAALSMQDAQLQDSQALGSRIAASAASEHSSKVDVLLGGLDGESQGIAAGAGQVRG